MRNAARRAQASLRTLCLGMLLLSVVNLQSQIQTNLDLGSVVYPDGVRFVEQEADGFLWLATDNGVMRTDGHRHVWVWRDDHVSVSCLKLTPRSVWVGTMTGELIHIDRASRAVLNRLPLASSSITCIEETPDGVLAFGTKENGLGWFDGQQTFLLASTAPAIDLSIHCLAHWREALYFATDRGVYRMNNWQMPNPEALDPNGDRLADQFVHVMVANPEALFLAGENGSITQLKPNQVIEQATYFNTWHHTAINHLALYDNQLLVVDASSRVYSMATDYLDRVSPIEQGENGPWAEPILDVQVNKQGLLMMTCGVAEVYSLDLIQSRLKAHDGVELAHVNTLFMTADRNFWLANEKGLFEHNSEFIDGQMMHQVMQNSNGSNIVALAELDEHRLLVGTFGDGLHLLDRRAGQIRQTKIQNKLINNNITSIELLGPNIWLSTLGGLMCLDASSLQVSAVYDDQSPMGATYLYCVEAGHQNDLWIGTDGKGLIHLADGKFENIRSTLPEISKSITAVEMDVEGRLWLLSLDKGIQSLRNGRLEEHAKLSNAYLGEIGAMLVMDDKRLLLHSARGIYLYDPSTEVLVLLNEERNVLAAGFQTMVIDAQRQKVWVARANDLWSCELNAFTQKHVPQLHLDGVLQSLSPVVSGQREFSHDQNHFTFLLSVPWFVPSEFPTIQYRLIGLDSSWIQTQERTLNYPQLAAGQYQLEVMVVMNKEAMPGTTVRYAFEILPPIYKRWWFLAIALLLLAAVIWSLAKWRLKQIQNRTMIRQRQLEGELQVLRSQINPHFLFNSFNTLSYTIEKDQGEAVEYVEQLSDYFRLVLQRTEETLIPLHEELALVKHYIYLQQKRFGDHFRVEMHVASQYHNWLIPPMVAQIILENAVKHNAISKDKPLCVQVFTEKDCLVIQNNINTMIKKPEGTGTGLYNCQRRLEILTERPMEVEQNEKEFLVRIPLIAAVKPTFPREKSHE